MNKIILITLMSILLNGCLWVMRVPLESERYIDDDGVTTNSVYRSLVTDARIHNAISTNKLECMEGIYPLTKVRCYFTHHSFQKRDYENLNGYELQKAKKVAKIAPFIAILLWIGEPADLIVDTVMLPWDLSY